MVVPGVLFADLTFVVQEPVDAGLKEKHSGSTQIGLALVRRTDMV